MGCLSDSTNEQTSGWFLFSTLKVFELLLTFCSVTGLRSLVCRALFTPASSKPKDPNVNSAYDVVLYWASQSVDTHSTVSLKALDFIKEIYEVRILRICDIYVVNWSNCLHMQVNLWLFLFTPGTCWWWPSGSVISPYIWSGPGTDTATHTTNRDWWGCTQTKVCTDQQGLGSS